jgi:ATP-binding protein involved in chromosome partitioning
VLGIVENMSGGIFGTGAAQDLAEDMGLPFLGKVSMRAEYLNAKQPAVLESDDIADEYSEIAANVRKQVEAAV